MNNTMKNGLLVAALFFIAAVSKTSAQTLTLQQCRDMAISHDEGLKAANIAARKAALDGENAISHFLPMVDASVSGIYRDDIGIKDVDLRFRGAVLAGITVTQPIYQGGRIVAANKLAKIGMASSLDQMRKTKAELLYDVDNAYYTLIAVKAKVDMLEAFVREMDQLKNDVKLFVDNGMAVKNDLLRIDNEQSEAQLQLTKARNGLQICRMVLANLIGENLEAAIEPADTFDIHDKSVTNQQFNVSQTADISARPELSLLQSQIKAAEQKVKIARADLLPTLGLQAGYSGFTNVKLKGQLTTLTGDVVNLNQNIHKSSPQIALVLNIPVFHWGIESRKVNKAKLDVELARLDLEQKSKKMNIELRQASLNLATSKDMVTTARKGLEQAEENRRISRQRYQVKLANMTEILDAESRWQKSYSSLIDALTQQRIYQTDYLRVTGQLE